MISNYVRTAWPEAFEEAPGTPNKATMRPQAVNTPETAHTRPEAHTVRPFPIKTAIVATAATIIMVAALFAPKEDAPAVPQGMEVIEAPAVTRSLAHSEAPGSADACTHDAYAAGAPCASLSMCTTCTAFNPIEASARPEAIAPATMRQEVTAAPVYTAPTRPITKSTTTPGNGGRRIVRESELLRCSGLHTGEAPIGLRRARKRF